MDKDNKILIDYLKTCYELEKSIYLQDKVVNSYRQKLSYYNNYEKRYKPLYRCNRTTIPDDYNQESGIYGTNPSYKKGLYTRPKYGFGNHMTEPGHSAEEVIIFLNAIKDLKYGFFESRVHKQLAAYNEALKEANPKISAYNAKIKSDSLEKASLVREALDKEEQCLLNSKQILQGFYDKDIIFIKYRSLVAISAILEYMISGRCVTLPEAYNKYEEELRQDIIIDKLDVIINRLERIERNQYMLYDAIMTANKQLKDISSGVDAALSSMSNIEDNTAIIAHSSKVIADNEDYQSKLQTFDVTYRFLRDL